MRSKKNRPGSTLVLVAMMLTALMGISAIAADIGRFYVVTGELQTAADAAALVGAATLQVTASSTPEAAVDAAVVAYVPPTNRADGTSMSVTDQDVELGYWTPGDAGAAGTFDTDLGTRRANAVSVKVSHDPRGVFAQIIGRGTGLPLQRRAIAWVANISLNCVRPWAFPYAPFYRRVQGVTTTTNPPPDVDPTSMIAFQNTSVANRTFIVTPPVSVPLDQTTFPNDSSWRGYNPPVNNSGGSNSGVTTFQQSILRCDNIAINSSAENGNTVPTQGNGNSCGADNVSACWAVDVIYGGQSGNQTGDGICAAYRSGDAGCYASATAATPGVTIDMAWADIVGGGQSVDFRYVGEFEMKCFFVSTTDTCAAIPDANPTKTGYPVGTIVGVATGLKSRLLNPTDKISNDPSNVQRLFLVK
jgi:Flp pilus assembly protein TadG